MYRDVGRTREKVENHELIKPPEQIRQQQSPCFIL